MPEYRAKPGQEDRHGEMTGAISFNMIFVYLPLTLWSVFIGPLFMDIRDVLLVGLVMAVVLTLIGVPISRWAWAHFSAWADTK